MSKGDDLSDSFKNLLVVCSFAKELKTTDASYKKLLFAIRPNLPEQFLVRVNQMFEWIREANPLRLLFQNPESTLHWSAALRSKILTSVVSEFH
jgi:hypothetical protein